MPTPARIPEFLRAAIDRIDPGDGTWITTTFDAAIKSAKDKTPGPLAGTTFAVKDLIDTAGVRTTYGSPLYTDNVPMQTASVVRHLEDLGGVCLGKTNLNEFAYGVSGYNPTFGMIRSPLDKTRTAGGSSGGSAAAVGASMVDIAIGTDTTGSVRIPAACCGVIGFKCAHGSQPMDGMHPLAPLMDSIGFFTRNVALLQVILGIDALPPVTQIRARPQDELALPPIPDAHIAVFRHQAYPLHRARSQQYPDRYGRDLRLKMREPLESDFADDLRTLLDWRREFTAAAAGVDVVVGPVFDGEVPTVDRMLAEYQADSLESSDRLQQHTAVASALGWPAMSVPTANGQVHLMARPGGEAMLLAHAARIVLPEQDQVHAN